MSHTPDSYGSKELKELRSDSIQAKHNVEATDQIRRTSDTKLPRSLRGLKHSSEARNHCRTVVVCLDGTGDQFDNDNSNVVHFVSCLKKHSPDEQVTYYQPGIGTYNQGGLSGGFKAGMDMAVGSGLGTHIKDAYRFLMQNYRDGDKICLFGFSRGAYTVRCLTGMLHKVGLLPASNGSQVDFAYEFYKDDTKEGWEMSGEFKRAFCTNVDVYFLGLWDCVASVGFIPRKLPFSKSPTNSVHHFRHAMALDERRAKFKVAQHQHQDPDLKKRDTIDATPKASMRREFDRTGIPAWFSSKGKGDQEQQNGNNSLPQNGEQHQKKKHFLGFMRKQLSVPEQDQFESEFNAMDERRRKHDKVDTDALEVWFLGAHADVGGGAVHNKKRHMLSRVPLRWMIRQCFECDTGILFSTAALANQGIDVHSVWPHYHPSQPASRELDPALLDRYEREKLPKLKRRSALLRIGDGEDQQENSRFRHAHESLLLPESTEDYFDARARINDQLIDAKSWWILEFWPVKVRVLSKDGDRWEKRVRLNMGRHRAVREKSPKLHWTVQRMVDEGRYEIKGRLEKNTKWVIVN